MAVGSRSLFDISITDLENLATRYRSKLAPEQQSALDKALKARKLTEEKARKAAEASASGGAGAASASGSAPAAGDGSHSAPTRKQALAEIDADIAGLKAKMDERGVKFKGALHGLDADLSEFEAAVNVVITEAIREARAPTAPAAGAGAGAPVEAAHAIAGAGVGGIDVVTTVDDARPMNGAGGAEASARDHAAGIPALSPELALSREIKDALEKLIGQVNGDFDGVKVLGALEFPVETYIASAASSTALHGATADDIAVEVIGGHTVIDVRPSPAAATPATPVTCSARLKTISIAVASAFYGSQYGMVAWEKSMQAFGIRALSGIFALASSAANFAQIFTTFEKIGPDIIKKITDLFNKLADKLKIESAALRTAIAVILTAVVAMAVFYIAFAAAIPVGSAVLGAYKYLGFAGLGPQLASGAMYLMRAILTARGDFNAPGSFYTKFCTMQAAWRKGNYAQFFSALMGILTGALIGVYYSLGQEGQIAEFLQALFGLNSASMLSLIIGWSGFAGSVGLNAFYVGNGTESFFKLIFSNDVTNKFLGVAALLISLATCFPGIALVVGGVLQKINAAVATWMSNFASIIGLGFFGTEQALGETRQELSEAINLLAAYREIARREGETYKKDLPILDVMIEALNALTAQINKLASAKKLIDYAAAADKTVRAAGTCVYTTATAFCHGHVGATAPRMDVVAINGDGKGAAATAFAAGAAPAGGMSSPLLGEAYDSAV